MNLKALRAGSHCVGDELCRAGGESCRTGFYFRKKEKHMDTIAAYLIFLNLVGFLIKEGRKCIDGGSQKECFF